jgi:hypothetical protein
MGWSTPWTNSGVADGCLCNLRLAPRFYVSSERKDSRGRSIAMTSRKGEWAVQRSTASTVCSFLQPSTATTPKTEAVVIDLAPHP